MTTAEQHRAKAAAHEAEEAASYERCGTDGFVSQWAHGVSAQRERLAAQLAEAGGVATFARYELHTLEGEPTGAKLIQGRYGPCWAFTEASGEFTGQFVSAHPVRESTMARKGYQEVEAEFTCPAQAVLRGAKGARGLAGAHTVRAIVVPAEGGVTWHKLVCLGEVE